MTEDYKGRIGNLIRDARKHRGMTQQQLAERLSTSQSAINRIEKGHQNLSLEMLARIGSALDSEIVALGAGPTHLRVTGPTTLSGSIAVKTSKNAGVALLCASLLNRGRTTLRKVARIEEVNRLLEVLDQPRRQDPVAQRRQRPRDRPAGRARPRQHRRGRRPPYPLGDHVPRTAAAPRRDLRAALRRRLQPRHPHGRAAHDGAAARSASRSRRPRAATTRRSTGATAPAAADRAHRARRHRHGERADGRRPPPGHHHHPQRLLQLHGPGPVLLPAAARRRRRGHRHHHPDRHRLRRDRPRRRLRPERGPDRGDVTAGRRDRDRLLDHHRAGADRVPRDRARAAGGDGLPATPGPRSTSPATATPGWSTSPPARACCTRRWTRSTRCRSPASTSTTCRSSR